MARAVAYDPGGSPAYVGQSMLITSCAGNGAFCHSDVARDRYGAPYGMNFDPTLADAARFTHEPTGARHLYQAQVASHRFRDDIFAQVVSGAMPPGGVGDTSAATPYRTFADASDGTGTPVPSLRTAEGREVLRNWLACGSPVVEATRYPDAVHCTSDADCAITHLCDETLSQCEDVGASVPVLLLTSPHWSSIFATIVAPTCAVALCHSPQSAAMSGQLDLSSPVGAYTALVGAPASTSACGTRIVAGRPDTSFFFQKLTGAQSAGCGDPMPSGGMLSSDQIADVRTWITNGAPMD